MEEIEETTIECKDCTPKDELKEGEMVECMLWPPCEKCGHHGVVASGLKPLNIRSTFVTDYNICSGCQHMTEAGVNNTKYSTMYDVAILWDFHAEICGSYKFDEVFEETAIKHARSIYDCGCERPFPIYQANHDLPSQETWGVLDETGKAPEGLRVFCANCLKKEDE
jgi:hypothetical protein